MLYESEPSIAPHRGQSGHMVNGKSLISLKNFDLGWNCRDFVSGSVSAYSFLPREIAIEASVFVLLQCISRRR